MHYIHESISFQINLNDKKNIWDDNVQVVKLDT